jgi:Flp pilus assembly protein TadG
MGDHQGQTLEWFDSPGLPEAAGDTSFSDLPCDRGGVSHGAYPYGSHHSWRTLEAGQELVEFSLVIFLLALFVFGAADLARIFHGLVVITNAAREGARYGVTHYGMNDPGSMSYTKTGYINSIVYRTRLEAQSSGINLSTSPVTVTCTWDLKDPTDPQDDVCQRQLPIRVTVNYQFNLWMNFILPSPISLTRFAEMMIP